MTTASRAGGLRYARGFATGAVAWLVAAASSGCNDATTPARRDAMRLYATATEHAMRLQLGAARDTYLAALSADPTYLPALLEFYYSSDTPSMRVAASLDSIGREAADRGMGRCISMAAGILRGALPNLPVMEGKSRAAGQCDFFARHYLLTPHGDTRPRRDSILMLVQTYPESRALLNAVLEDLRTQLAPGDYLRIVARAMGPGSPAPVRAYAYATGAIEEHERGRDEDAQALERNVTRDPDWRLPGFRLAWSQVVAGHPFMQTLAARADPSPLARHVDSVLAASVAISRAARAEGDIVARIGIGMNLGVAFLDRGHFGEAIRELGAVVPAADSMGETSWRSFARMRLGRALVKAGRSAEAERMLLQARTLGDAAGMPRIQKEVEHNLLHLYESLGRDAEARAAADGFVRFTRPGGLDPTRMMSARDYGMFLRARGRVAESESHFARMLADIDSMPRLSFFGGEYREVTGDLETAQAYYTRALRGSHEPMRALEGLVRIALAMGDTASARHWATLHDARRDAAGRPESGPLLPGVLQRVASAAEAVAAYEPARREVSRHGQVAAWATLTAELASLEADLGHMARAGLLADSAAASAASVGASDVAQRARAISAFARTRGDTNSARRDAALRDLMALAEAGDDGAPLQLRADLHRLVARSLTASKRWREALLWYRRATDPLDSVASNIAMDPAQAAYRSAQRRVYNDALQTIIEHAGAPGAAAAYAAWSARRKGRAYAVQFPAFREASVARPPPGTASIDFVLLDSTVAALVATASGSTIVPLPVPAREIIADVNVLRRSVDVRVGSALDVGRARYPLGTAHRLYNALLAPLEVAIGDARVLIIVPDGILGLVPFDALVATLPPDGVDERLASYVIDRRTVVGATTGLVSEDVWRFPAGPVAVIGPANAPAADREVTSVVAALPASRTRVARGAGATKRVALDLMRDAAVVHFAAHAEANERNPGSSHMDLAPEGADDGRLGALEVASLRLRAPLVVLSACETANGRVLDGEGVLSLSRSFLRAGARATIATLWPVGESAAEFAAAFYASASQTGDAAQALRAAKLAMREHGAPASAWAPYQLFAGPAPRRLERPVAARE